MLQNKAFKTAVGKSSDASKYSRAKPLGAKEFWGVVDEN